MTPREHAQIAGDLFKDKLKAARKQAGLTQDDLVARADISAVTLSKLETGVNKPAFEIFVALAYALQVAPNFLVGWEEEVDLHSTANRRELLHRLQIAVSSLPDHWLEQLLSVAETASKDR